MARLLLTGGRDRFSPIASLGEAIGSRFRDLTVQRKILLLSLSASSVALVLASAGFVTYQLRLESRAERERLTTVAEVIAVNSTAALSFGDAISARSALEALRAVENVVAGCIYQADGTLFVEVLRHGSQDRAASCAPTAEAAAERGRASTVRAPIVLHGEAIGSVAIRSQPMALSQRLVGYGSIVTFVLVASSLLAFAIAAWLQRFISAPLLELVDTARRVAVEKDYSLRAAGGGRDEVGLLLAAFNEMLTQIQERDRELEAFSYSVSHDLRSPLRLLDGFSSILLEDQGDRLDATGKDYLQRIRAAAQHMGALVNDLLLLARVPRAPMHSVPIDLSSMAAGILAELRAAAPERSVRVRVAPNVVGVGDPGLVHAALANLLENAWKFTARRSPAEIEFAAFERDGHRVYFVRDNGTGFDMVYAGKLFMAFERLHSSEEFKGTGIGLATVERIVRRHGGAVWCEAAVDAGATFYFTLNAEAPLGAYAGSRVLRS